MEGISEEEQTIGIITASVCVLLITGAVSLAAGPPNDARCYVYAPMRAAKSSYPQTKITSYVAIALESIRSCTVLRKSQGGL